MDKKAKLKAWIKNQKNCINFTQNTLSDMGETAAKSNTFDMKMGVQKLIGGLRAYKNCYELFYNTPPAAATSDLEYSENLPNQEGYYWTRSKSGLEGVKRVFFNYHDELCIWVTDPQGKDCIISIERLKNSQWAGPIAHPVK